MSALAIVGIIFAIGYLCTQWYKSYNKDIMNSYLAGKKHDFLFVENDNSKAVGIDKYHRTLYIYTINKDDTVNEVSFAIEKIKKIELIEDTDADQKCKYVRVNIYIDTMSDDSLCQIIFLSPTWTLDGHDGYQHSSDKYLKAKREANKLVTIIESINNR